MHLLLITCVHVSPCVHPCLFVACIPAFSSRASPPLRHIHPRLLVACIRAFLSHASMPSRRMHPHLFVMCIHPRLFIACTHTFRCVHPRLFLVSPSPLVTRCVYAPGAPSLLTFRTSALRELLSFDVPHVCSPGAPSPLMFRTSALRELLFF